MSDYDPDYYGQRAAKSRELAAAAVDPKIAAIHLKMAERYDLPASPEKGDVPPARAFRNGGTCLGFSTSANASGVSSGCRRFPASIRVAGAFPGGGACRVALL